MTPSRVLSGCSTLALTLTALCLPTLAFGACQDVRDRIARNIESNGVEPMGYSLEVIPTADADQAEGQIVGHCDSNRYQIVYQRYYRNSSAETMEDASADDDIEGTAQTVPDSASPAASVTAETSDAMEASRDSAASGDRALSDEAPEADGQRVETRDMPVGAENARRRD